MLKASYNIKTMNQNRIIQEVSAISDSFVKQLIDILYRHLSKSDYASTDITGSTNTSGNSGGDLKIASEGGMSGQESSSDENYGANLGIQVGTGTTSVTPTDNVLESRIAHGAGTGELYHYGAKCDDPTVADPDGSFKTTKIFENKSGASITINEIGMYSQGNGGCGIYCILRDVLGTSITVANDEILKVEYTLSITV